MGESLRSRITKIWKSDKELIDEEAREIFEETFEEEYREKMIGFAKERAREEAKRLVEIEMAKILKQEKRKKRDFVD